ncbi:MAG: transcription-repair coupling factor [SAR202 cluster bacterium]|nr:transcription-repair coupling factor [SAR202 cluster bacterium]
MSLTGLLSVLTTLPGYQRLLEEARQRRSSLAPFAAGAKPFLLSALARDLRAPLLIITPKTESARRLHEQLLLYLGDDAPLYLFPEPDVLPLERLAADASTNNQRLAALDALMNNGGASPMIIASLSAALRKTLSPNTFKQTAHTLKTGQQIRIGELTERWVSMGYRREESVEIPGTFTLRGGIVDIFTPNSSLPARLDLIGNDIESITLFDSATQRSVQPADAIRIVPAHEVLPIFADRRRVSDLIANLNLSDCRGEVRDRIQDDLASIFTGHNQEDLSFYNGLINNSTILDYLPPEAILVLDHPTQLDGEADSLEARVQETRQARVGRGELPANFPMPQLPWSNFKQDAANHVSISLTPWATPDGDTPFKTPDSFFGRLDQFTAAVLGLARNGASIVVVTRHSRRLSEVLAEAGVSASVAETLGTSPNPGRAALIQGALEQGWVLESSGRIVALFTDAEIFGAVKERRIHPKRTIKKAPFLSQLEPGMYVVHEDHGIARFGGAKSMETAGEQREYLVLEYAEGDKLYLPTDHLDRISPYVNTSDKPPALTRLSSPEWARAKQRAKASTQELAKELLDIHAGRQMAQGHPYSPDTVWQQEMEDAFPFEETADQSHTIEEVKADMESPRPMDRLVCGDVGYGKTEVALRAAFKAVADDMQVAILVPTTVLAQQHYATFSSRLTPYPVTVEVLSRFRSSKEQDAVIERLKSGEVDIVIGTHRLLQKDVRFKRLGLVIIDEEHRFGVSHKERLKRLRQEVDILTLSATPIPRTLYMSLAGIRDMSTMETPPEERHPVKTYVGEYSDDAVKEAILRELDRGGQVFFLHNRISSIRRVAGELSKLVPQTRITVAHGRMAEDELEAQMLAFANGESDVLVCTTIIESGLDIPNANTLIIDRADRYGLSQLYQLRGRVGRSSSRAYCYLFVPKGRKITEEAEKRLRAILEASELGAGFRLAMRDLEIRGAGNILGAEQSGHIHAVGFELYSSLLNQAVAELRAQQGQAPVDGLKPKDEIRVDLPLSAHLPQDYISHLPNRLAVYKRLAALDTLDKIDDIREELADRFGPPPPAVEDLLYGITVKTLARDVGVQSVAHSSDAIILNLKEPVGGARLPLEKALGSWAKVGNMQVRLDKHLMGPQWQKGLLTILKAMKAFQYRLAALPVG